MEKPELIEALLELALVVIFALAMLYLLSDDTHIWYGVIV